MVLRLTLLFILLTVATSALATAMSKQVVLQSYDEWMRCHNNPNAANCPACDDDNSEIPEETREFLALRCLPSRSETEYVFSDLLSIEQRRARDSRICRCYLDGNAGGLEAYSFNSGPALPSAPPPPLDGGVAYRDLLNQRVLTVLSATSYTRTDSDTAELGGRYSFASPTAESMRTTTVRLLASEANRLPGGFGMGATMSAASQTEEFQNWIREADQTELNSSILNSSKLNQEQFCIPYRNFLASQEFPREQSFYQDLRGMQRFEPSAWNYTTLMNTYRIQKGTRDESDFNKSPEGKQLYERLRFLHNNPVIRDVFLSPESPASEESTKNREAKELIFSQIKKMPLPCQRADCSQDTNWIGQMQTYRQEMLGVLNDDRVISATKIGTNDYRQMIMNLNSVRGNNETSDTVIGSSASFDSSQWSNFCANRDRSDAVSIFDRLFSDFGRRNAVEPQNDAKYKDLNRRVCTDNRVSGQGLGMNLRDYISNFRRTNCAGQNPANPLCREENRTQLIAQFIREYPADSDTGATDTLWALVPYLEGEMRISRIPEGAIQDLNNIAASPERRKQRFNYTEPGVVSDSSSSSSISQIARGPAGTTAQSTQSAVPAVQSGNGNPPQADSVFVPQASASQLSPQAVQAAQAELEEGEGESQRIRDEISSLRDVMRREPQSGGARSSQAMNDLNQRLASLERRLVERERENSELRDRIAEAQSQTPSGVQPATQALAGSVRRSESGSAAQAVAQGGASSGSSVAAPVASGPVPSSSVSGRTAIASPRAVLSSGNAALLSKYGVQSGSVQGSLIVANASTTIDYQALRSQSEGSVLSLPLPIEEYNLIASNNQEALRPYLDQCRALAGSVCRLNISSPGTSNQMELFVVKNGNDVSIIPTNSPGRSPAAVPAGARVFTLNELQNELLTR